MVTKLQRVKNLMASGRELEALRLVAKFPRLPAEEGAVIRRAVAVLLSPELYTQMGFRKDVCVQQALDAIRRVYNLTPTEKTMTDADTLEAAGFIDDGDGGWVRVLSDGRRVEVSWSGPPDNCWGWTVYAADGTRDGSGSGTATAADTLAHLHAEYGIPE
jgi:hypothetical protein